MEDISPNCSTLHILFRAFGQTMTLEQLRSHFFPNHCTKTLHNMSSNGLLPPKVGRVFDIRDVAEWWDAKRAESQRYANIGGARRRRGSMAQDRPRAPSPPALRFR